MATVDLTSDPYQPDDPSFATVAHLDALIDGLHERIRALEALAIASGDETATYRIMLRLALGSIHDLQARLDAITARYHRLLAEKRRSA